MITITGCPMRGAVFSPCRRYRYALWRRWAEGPYALFIGLNPSTADELDDDNTIRRCIRYSKDWGYSGLMMANLFAFRSTDPKVMRHAVDPVGDDNDRWLRCLAGDAGVIVAAWGAHGEHRGRDMTVVCSTLLNFELRCLGLTRDGHPRHPLRLRADERLVAYPQRTAVAP